MPLTLGERVQLVRRRCGLTQAQLAALVGVRGNTISRIEKSPLSGGFAEVGSRTIVALARHLRVSADYLLGLSDDDGAIAWPEEQQGETPPRQRKAPVSPPARTRRRTTKPVGSEAAP